MKDDFEATFVVELAPDEVWEALTRRTLQSDTGETRYVLAGFPSFTPLPESGASCTPIELDAPRLLRVKKDDHPCAGTEIAITLEQASTGTRVTVVQSGFGAFLDFAGRDTVFGHGLQIVNDLRLFIERGLTVPGTDWGRNFGARFVQTGVGVAVDGVEDGGFAANAGMRDGDLLLTLRGLRIHDIQQLWTVLALSEIGPPADVTWAREREPMQGQAAFTA